MIPQFYLYLGVAILLMTIGRIVWRRSPKAVDWELIVAFVRLDFPPEQRDVAQKIAAGLAEIVGLKIKELRPDTTLDQIADWAENRIHATDLITLFRFTYGVKCEAATTFRALVEQVVERQTKNAKHAS